VHCFLARVGLDLSRLLHTDIGSLLPISFRSLLIHVYLTRSVIVFCIGRALPIRHLRDIRNSSRYALGFYFVYSLSITGQIDWHAWSTFRAWRTLALGFQCVVTFASTEARGPTWSSRTAGACGVLTESKLLYLQTE